VDTVIKLQPAAQALAAGNQPLYQRWLRAAAATAEVVKFDVRELTAIATDAVIKATDSLAAQAQAQAQAQDPETVREGFPPSRTANAACVL
jgi:hypothetical protein